MKNVPPALANIEGLVTTDFANSGYTVTYDVATNTYNCVASAAASADTTEKAAALAALDVNKVAVEIANEETWDFEVFDSAGEPANNILNTSTSVSNGGALSVFQGHRR